MISGMGCSGANGDGFSDELSRLKRQGASVLAVGTVQPHQCQDTCRRLLGCPTDRVRRRVLVSTTDGPHSASHLVDNSSPDTLARISYDAQAPSAATTAPTAAPSIEPSTTDIDTLADLGIAISTAIDSFEDDTDALEPADIRVGIDSLRPLLEEHDDQRVFKFLHLINGRTKAVNGIAHYHLPVERDSRIAAVLSPLFDVVVELRDHGNTYQERWLIDDGSDSSGWLPVASD